MHTVEMLEEAIALAGEHGIGVRQEWLGGGGGACEIRGKWWVFIDLAASPQERLDRVLEALRGVPNFSQPSQAPSLRELLAARRAA